MSKCFREKAVDFVRADSGKPDDDRKRKWIQNNKRVREGEKGNKEIGIK